MKKLFITIITLAAIALQSSAHEVPLVQNPYGRSHQLLNGAWNYIVDQQEVGYYSYRREPYDTGFFLNHKPTDKKELVEYDFDLSPVMQIPSDWNTADQKLFHYEGTIWFKRSFDPTPTLPSREGVSYNTQHQSSPLGGNEGGHSTSQGAGGSYILYFGAVNYECRVWLNGKYLGHHVGGYTPFNFDVTDILREGSNDLVVMVDNKRHQDNIPTLIFDWWNYGGITRDVMLIKQPKTYIQDYTVRLKDKHFNAKARQHDIVIEAQLNEAVAGQKVSVNIPELGIKKQLTTDADGHVATTVKAKPQLWQPGAPKLYPTTLSLGSSTVKDDIAFRYIETEGKKILLNGKPVFLKGISIHEEKPYTAGRCNSTRDAETLLSWAEELGCNYVRLAHYPHNELMVREAERRGIMVWSEIPVYWTISWENPATYANAEHQLDGMMTRDHNRGNIIIWSIANETPHSAPRDAFLSKLARFAHQKDSTRLISMAMEVTSADHFHNRLQDNMNQYVDVISFNQYIGWYRDVDDALKMTWEIPYDKPVIISEMGGGAVAGRHGDKGERWTEEFQAELYRQNFVMLDKIDGLAGVSPWILKDFMSPRRPLYGTQTWFNRKGLFSDQGLKKQAFYVVRDWYRNKP